MRRSFFTAPTPRLHEVKSMTSSHNRIWNLTSFDNLPLNWLRTNLVWELWRNFFAFTCFGVYSLKLCRNEPFLIPNFLSLLPVRPLVKLNTNEWKVQFEIALWWSNIGRHLWKGIFNTSQTEAPNSSRGVLERKTCPKRSQKRFSKTNFRNLFMSPLAPVSKY